MQAGNKDCEGLTGSVQEVAGNEVAAQQDPRRWENICVKMSPRLDDYSGLHNTFTGLQCSGRALVTDDEVATGRGSVPQCSTLIRTLEHFDEVGF